MNQSVCYVLKQYPRLSETFILNEILGLEANGVDLSIVSLRPASEGRFHPALSDVNASVTYIPTAIERAGFLESMRSLNNVGGQGLGQAMSFLDRIPAERQARMLYQAIHVAETVTRQGANHMHAHFLTIAAHTCHLVHLLTGIPYSVTAHAKDIYRTSIDWDLARVVAQDAAAIITVCDANAEHLEERLANANIHRIYNGIAPTSHAVSASQRPDDLLLGVGRLVPKKGFDHLIRSVAALRDQGRMVRARILGDGECRSDLEHLAASLEVTDQIEFFGACTQDVVAEQMREATLLVAPCVVGPDGNQDALPTVLVEALAAGLPVVSTDVAGIPEIFDHGVHGQIVPTVGTSLDASRLLDEIASLLDSPESRQAMSSAGPERARERFDRSITTAELAELFASVQMKQAAA